MLTVGVRVGHLQFTAHYLRSTIRGEEAGTRHAAAVIAVPAVGYQFYVYHIDAVYRLRANTPTPSPPLWSFFEGYGLVLVLAIAGAILAMRNAECGMRYPVVRI